MKITKDFDWNNFSWGEVVEIYNPYNNKKEERYYLETHCKECGKLIIPKMVKSSSCSKMWMTSHNHNTGKFCRDNKKCKRAFDARRDYRKKNHVYPIEPADKWLCTPKLNNYYDYMVKRDLRFTGYRGKSDWKIPRWVEE